MTRPIIGKMRTVVLPTIALAGLTLSLNDYKERTGIDLLDVFDFVLDDGYINIYGKKNTLILIESAKLDVDDNAIENGLQPLNDYKVADQWVSGSSYANTLIGYSIFENGEPATLGQISFTILQSAEFKLENILVGVGFN